MFPHLKDINMNNDFSAEQNVNGIVIRSANDDNVHKVRIKLFRPSSMGFGLLRPRIRVKFNSFGRGN